MNAGMLIDSSVLTVVALRWMTKILIGRRP